MATYRCLRRQKSRWHELLGRLVRRRGVVAQGLRMWSCGLAFALQASWSQSSPGRHELLRGDI